MALERGYLVEPGGAGEIRTLPILSTQTYKVGDLLTIDGTGRLQQLVATNTAYTSQVFVGWALTPAVNDQGTAYATGQIQLFKPDLLMALPLYSATATNAVWNSDLLGNKYGFINTTNGFPAVNFDDTTNTKCIIVGVVYDDAPGYLTGTTGAFTTQYPKVIVVPLAAACLLCGTVS